MDWKKNLPLVVGGTSPTFSMSHLHFYEYLATMHVRCSCGDIIRCVDDEDMVRKTSKTGYDTFQIIDFTFTSDNSYYKYDTTSNKVTLT